MFVSDSPDRSAGVFEMYVDNVVNVDADGSGRLPDYRLRRLQRV